MHKWIKTILFWILIFPILATSLLIIIDYFVGESTELYSYLPHLLGFATGGFFIGFIMYQVKKLKSEQ